MAKTEIHSIDSNFTLPALPTLLLMTGISFMTFGCNIPYGTLDFNTASSGSSSDSPPGTGGSGSTTSASTASGNPPQSPPPPPISAPAPSENATSGSAVWHSATSVMTAGDFGNLYYSPSGDLYVTYSELSGSDEYGYVISRLGNGSFTTPVELLEGRPSSMYFESNSDFLISLNTVINANIVESTDSGSVWSYVTSYANVDNDDSIWVGSLSLMHSTFVSISGVLNLFYGYWYTNTPLGPMPSARFASTVDGVWQMSTAGLPGDDVGTILSQGADVLMTPGFLSTNAGATFTRMSQTFSEISQRSTDGMLFSSIGGSTNGWSVWESPDFGTTWDALELDISDAFTSDIGDSKVVAQGNIIVAIATVNGDQIYSMISYDNGASWNLPSLIVDISSTTNKISNTSLAVSNSRIGLVYSIEDGNGNRLGVNLIELY